MVLSSSRIQGTTSALPSDEEAWRLSVRSRSPWLNAPHAARYLLGCATNETFTRAPRDRGVTFLRHVR